MAQVALDPRTRAWIDDDLDYLLREWRAIPEIAGEWDTWDEIERLDFVVEWPLRIDRWIRLQGWVEKGELTSPQLDRYRELVDVIQRHQATLERLLAD